MVDSPSKQEREGQTCWLVCWISIGCVDRFGVRIIATRYKELKRNVEADYFVVNENIVSTVSTMQTESLRPLLVQNGSWISYIDQKESMESRLSDQVKPSISSVYPMHTAQETHHQKCSCDDTLGEEMEVFSRDTFRMVANRLETIARDQNQALNRWDRFVY